MPGNSTTAEPTRVTRDGIELVVAPGEATRGSDAPFYPVYRDGDRTLPYGWFCADCESVDTAMDPMGSIECRDCGNRRRATRWDAAYL